jgi:hypothetical protein
MDETNDGGATAEQKGMPTAIDQAWRLLRGRLAEQLARMTTDEDHLLLEMPDGNGDGCTPYIQFAGFGGGTMLRTELSGNAHLAPAYELDADDCDTMRAMGWRGNDAECSNWFLECPVGHAPVAATIALGSLQTMMLVAHPQLLTYDAWGPAADSVPVLGLSATEEVPQEPAAQPLALMPSGRSELAAIVGATLANHLGEMPPVDDDGDFVLTHLGQPVWVRVRTDQPAVEILARVTHGVHSRRATATEIGVLNRRHMWTQWVLSGREVYMRLPMPALPFVPRHLTSMLDLYLAAMTETRDDLALRVGGRVA